MLTCFCGSKCCQDTSACINKYLTPFTGVQVSLYCPQPGQSAPEMAAAAAAAAVVREAAASAVMDVLDAGESEEEKSSKLAAAKEDKMRKVIRSVFGPFWST